jgi:Cu+-exporting ATPase
MTCAACQSAVQHVLQQVDGVSHATVSLMTNRAEVHFDPQRVDVNTLVQRIEDAGFDARLPSVAASAFAEQQRQDEAAQQELANLQRAAAWSLAAAAAAMLLSMPLMAGAAGHGNLPGPLALIHVGMEFADAALRALAPWLYALDPQWLRWTLCALSLSVMAGPGRFFYARAWTAARHGGADMNTLVAVGTGAAFGYSLVVTVSPGLLAIRGIPAEVYYEAVVFILALVLLGNSLERKARQRASAAIRELASLQPPIARLITQEGVREVPVASLRRGDRVMAPPGERAPVDGVVESGMSAVDESLLTGESMPVAKQPGDAITGGSLVVEAALQYRVTRTGEEGTLARIVRLMRDAQSSQAPVQRLADRISAVFVPVVMGIAMLTFLGWMTLPGEASVAQALAVAVTVLIIACPCAMGLAVPTAVLVSSGRGARMGILIKGGEPLERLGAIDAVLFDKTGTVTEGKPELTDWLEPAGGMQPGILSAVAAVEQASSHPLASAMVRYAQQHAVSSAKATALRSIPGRGAEGNVEGEVFRVGAAPWLRESGVENIERAQHLAAPLLAEGKTVVYVSRNQQVVAVAGFADTLRPQSAAAVAALRAMGVQVHLLTGDKRETAAAIAWRLGIAHVHAEMLPEGKLDVVRALQAKGLRVAMVGDGINDAPALAAADVGIAMGLGAEVAAEAASVTLMRNDPSAVASAIALSRATMRVMRQNLFWAFLYNVVGIPIAAGLLYPAFGILLSPILASAAMAFSSVSVVTNSLRLRRVGIAPTVVGSLSHAA